VDSGKYIAFFGRSFVILRYGTHGMNEIENCHPMLRQSNWQQKFGNGWKLQHDQW
jgi:amidophosphoribosyltransferase